LGGKNGAKKGGIELTKRSFRAFAEREDLQSIFVQFENAVNVYYVPTYSDTGKAEIDNIEKSESFGINESGSQLGEQFLAFLKGQKCIWREYQCKDGTGLKTRYTALSDGNEECINISLGGIYKGNNLLPTTISSMHYENETSKKLFDELKKTIRKMSVKTIDGYYICPCAYIKRDNYRFCKIDFKSPKEYDLKFQ